MHDRTARVFSGLGVLVLIWIVAYWIWTPRDDGTSLPGVSLSEPEDIESPAGPIDRRNKQSDRFPSSGIGNDQLGYGSESVPNELLEQDESESRADDARPPPPANSGVIPPVFDDYIIVGGDNFERISQKVYGTRQHAMAIARSNPLLDPRKLKAGDTIRVPSNPANIQGIPIDEDGAPEERPVPDSAPQSIEYTVKRGDTLSGIAKAFYGSIKHVDYLYEANRGRMSSKDDLRLGQVLLVPPLPEGAD